MRAIHRVAYSSCLTSCTVFILSFLFVVCKVLYACLLYAVFSLLCRLLFAAVCGSVFSLLLCVVVYLLEVLSCSMWSSIYCMWCVSGLCLWTSCLWHRLLFASVCGLVCRRVWTHVCRRVWTHVFRGTSFLCGLSRFYKVYVVLCVVCEGCSECGV